MVRTFAVLAAAALILVPGVVQGVRTDRWGKSQELEAAVARLNRMPLTVGDWNGQPAELDTDQVEGADLAGYVARRYERGDKRAAVSVVLMCGRPGPLSAHTPEVCYLSSGYELVGGRERVEEPAGADRGPAEFWAARFRKGRGPVATSCRVFWAWGPDGAWSAPANPRFAFARCPALYKLYVIRNLGAADEPLADDPCQDFLRQLLPELQKALGEAG